MVRLRTSDTRLYIFYRCVGARRLLAARTPTCVCTQPRESRRLRQGRAEKTVHQPREPNVRDRAPVRPGHIRPPIPPAQRSRLQAVLFDAQGVPPACASAAPAMSAPHAELAQGENVSAAKLAYDRPSMKLLGFLSKCATRLQCRMTHCKPVHHVASPCIAGQSVNLLVFRSKSECNICICACVCVCVCSHPLFSLMYRSDDRSMAG
jgi:hypothetical protein